MSFVLQIRQIRVTTSCMILRDLADGNSDRSGGAASALRWEGAALGGSALLMSLEL